MMDTPALLVSALEWLEHQAAELKFGEAGVRVTVHAGRITRIEKTITEKEQAEK